MSWGVLFWDVLYIYSFGTQTVVSKYHFLVKGSLPGATSEFKAEVWNVHGESGNLPRKQGDGPKVLVESKGFRSQLAEVLTHQEQDNLSMKKHSNWNGLTHSSDTCIHGFTMILKTKHPYWALLGDTRESTLFQILAHKENELSIYPPFPRHICLWGKQIIDEGWLLCRENF